MYKPNQPMQSAQDEDDSIFDDEDYSVRKRNFFFFKCWRGPPFMGTQKKTKEKEREETRLGCTLKVHHNVSIFPDFVS